MMAYSDCTAESLSLSPSGGSGIVLALWVAITQIYQNKCGVSGISQSITVEMVTGRFIMILPSCTLLAENIQDLYTSPKLNDCKLFFLQLSSKFLLKHGIQAENNTISRVSFKQ